MEQNVKTGHGRGGVFHQSLHYGKTERIFIDVGNAHSLAVLCVVFGLCESGYTEENKWHIRKMIFTALKINAIERMMQFSAFGVYFVVLMVDIIDVEALIWAFGW